jgi:hypothetical protein
VPLPLSGRGSPDLARQYDLLGRAFGSTAAERSSAASLAALAVSDQPDDGDDLRTALLVIGHDLVVHGCRSYRTEVRRSSLGGDHELAGFP